MLAKATPKRIQQESNEAVKFCHVTQTEQKELPLTVLMGAIAHLFLPLIGLHVINEHIYLMVLIRSFCLLALTLVLASQLCQPVSNLCVPTGSRK